jgi:hypothetical protein
MKKLFLLIAISSILFGCSDENEPKQTEVVGEIVGQWKLIYVHQHSWDSYISDEAAKNIVCNFKSNGILDVSAETALLKKGQHNYSFGEETLTIGGQSFETQVVTIRGRKWLYSFSDGQMSISELDSDGGTLTFVTH